MENREAVILAAINNGQKRYEEIQAEGDASPLFGLPREEIIRQTLLDIAAQFMPGSTLSKALDEFEASDEKPFVGTVVSCKRNAKNDRVRVIYKPAKPGDYTNEDGTEEISTEPIYKQDGLGIATLAKSLIGHRVLIVKQGETFRDKEGKTKKGKVLRWLVDLGPAEV